MIEISTTNIYTIHNDGLYPRQGNVVIDEPSEITCNCDARGLIYVRSGLLSRDVVVFLGYEDNSGQTEIDRSVGYLVTAVDNTGGGILVSGQLVESRPHDWMNDRVIGAFALLGTDYPISDFGLANTQRYLDSLS